MKHQATKTSLFLPPFLQLFTPCSLCFQFAIYCSFLTDRDRFLPSAPLPWGHSLVIYQLSSGNTRNSSCSHHQCRHRQLPWCVSWFSGFVILESRSIWSCLGLLHIWSPEFPGVLLASSSTSPDSFLFFLLFLFFETGSVTLQLRLG